ncbi:hypothetical protein F4802DRAFT_551042 [Xylaria palmicola]|nr:hypothetical protein F4802DRAFT_551042 [Xylaria palmicola]
MGEMHIAERKNERRLKRMYRTGQVDESEVNSYPTDENNVTGKASILVWRARTQKNNKVSIGRVQEQVFRDPIGKPIQSASIRISLEDCVCKGDIVSAKSSKAPLLEITAEALCKAIDTDLREYREERAEVIRTAVQKEKQKKEKLREEERIRRAAEERTREGAGVLGRVMEQGRLFSARLIDRKL